LVILHSLQEKKWSEWIKKPAQQEFIFVATVLLSTWILR
jgi:hypothetical protein